jgi:dienelactone hydrolase
MQPHQNPIAANLQGKAKITSETTCMMHSSKPVAALLLKAAALISHAQTQLKIDNAGLALDGYWYPASGKAPTIIALHGCSGMLNAQGKPNLRTAGYAKLLNAEGWHVLFVDSLTPRGEKSVCGGMSAVSPALRVSDVRAAVAYVAQQPNVDSACLALLGWSHGGSTGLLANTASVQYAVQPKAVVTFYPGCGSREAQARWQPALPHLMLLGAADDWTPPASCQRLAERFPQQIRVQTYADAHHGFDSDAPLQLVKGVISVTTKQPVHLGGNSAAKAASQAELIKFLKEHFQ